MRVEGMNKRKKMGTLSFILLFHMNVQLKKAIMVTEWEKAVAHES